MRHSASMSETLHSLPRRVRYSGLFEFKVKFDLPMPSSYLCNFMLYWTMLWWDISVCKAFHYYSIGCTMVEGIKNRKFFIYICSNWKMYNIWITITMSSSTSESMFFMILDCIWNYTIRSAVCVLEVSASYSQNEKCLFCCYEFSGLTKHYLNRWRPSSLMI